MKKPRAKYYDRLETRPPGKREAALMAALPKLIAACQTALAHFALCDDHGSESAETGATAIEQLHDALALATGRAG